MLINKGGSVINLIPEIGNVFLWDIHMGKRDGVCMI